MSTLPPSNCFGCGKTVSHLYKPYNKLLHQDISPFEAIKHFPELKRHCCRTRLRTAIDNIDEQSAYMAQHRIKQSVIENLPTPTTSYLRPKEIQSYFEELAKNENKKEENINQKENNKSKSIIINRDKSNSKPQSKSSLLKRTKEVELCESNELSSSSSLAITSPTKNSSKKQKMNHISPRTSPSRRTDRNSPSKQSLKDDNNNNNNNIIEE